VTIESDSSTCELGSFSYARRFFQLWVESQKEPDIRPNPIVDVGRRVSRVEMNAKNAPLTPPLPTPTPLYAIFTAKGRKNRLDKADVVIDGHDPFFRVTAGRR
jgi:hypothetical protein